MGNLCFLASAVSLLISPLSIILRSGDGFPLGVFASKHLAGMNERGERERGRRGIAFSWRRLYVHDMFFFVYIMANRRNGTIYIGQTGDLIARVEDHQSRQFEGFTKDWGCVRLVWFEIHETRESAFIRERRMKKWNRAWKVSMIERLNPDWRDLSVCMDERLLYDEAHFFPTFGNPKTARFQ